MSFINRETEEICQTNCLEEVTLCDYQPLSSNVAQLNRMFLYAVEVTS